MNIRKAQPDDWSRIRAVAEQSFQASYSLSPEEITAIIESAFTEDVLRERTAGSEGLVFVADAPTDEGETVVGFADVERENGGTLRWLHVDPDARGNGVGTALIERVRRELGDGDETTFTARVLDAAVEGGAFLERFGLYQTGNATFELDGERFGERLFTEDGQSPDANEPAVELPETVAVDDERLPVDRDDSIPGTDAPFFRVFESDAREDTWGYICSNCAGTDVSADGLDRLQCGTCGNEHLADKWDAAYL